MYTMKDKNHKNTQTVYKYRKVINKTKQDFSKLECKYTFLQPNLLLRLNLSGRECS